MGNKIGRRRQVVDEKYTRPQGLYNHKDVDHKKLRKLILESKLAPCYPGDEESTYDLEECPICFLCYPSLNRSRCCMKSICTECFLQMKVPNSTRPTQCPFCKTANYAVEFRGVKSKEEKGLEQIEEQRVIEAKIRMHQQELKDEEERINKRLEISSSNGNVAPVDSEYSSNAAAGSSISVVEGEEIISAQDSCVTPTVRRPAPAARTIRDDEFDIDLEDIMVMEAVWLSIQENGRQRNLCSPYAPSRQYITDDCYVSPSLGPQSGSSSSPSGGLACAIAALAERQQVGGESSISSIDGNTTSFTMPQRAGGLYSRLDRDSVSYLPTNNLHEIPPNETMVMTRGHGEWGMGHVTPVAGAATFYGGSVAAEDDSSLSLRQLDDADGSIASSTDPIVPESFEEQMMLAMAVSLAEAQAVSSGQGSSWQ